MGWRAGGAAASTHPGLGATTVLVDGVRLHFITANLEPEGPFQAYYCTIWSPRLVHFGWETLERGTTAFFSPISAPTPLCAPLSVRFALELFRMLRLALLCAVSSECFADRVDVMSWLVVRDAYVADQEDTAGNACVLAMVDAYALPTMTLHDVLARVPRFEVVVPAIMRAIDRAPRLVQGTHSARWNNLVSARQPPSDGSDRNRNLVAATVDNLRWHAQLDPGARPPARVLHL
ncbi:hypothetical protein SDRG_00980 [Saprolegnia diclina VS20]|uniref:Uncharacterized protein n=1 Tax=Saprolegnia diclina (strain VS20) TaxID=1156394 RepID=T0R6Q9_SAPDV|nr:hypothetical protein SDRG_00980 [Saprolegnia diclina VS20]EQC42140.1 hypothetical protein SDRG_00980 [Saprolegnia diclina VS20]|eukprot:XP_008604709.1 hypothetical protein SDRG_00980 [Saprolegnia diclina VS20]